MNFMYYKLRLLLACFIFLNACSGQKKDNSMKAVFEFENNEVVPNIQQYKTRPLYGVQINKNNCRVLITCNDIPHWLTFYENYGESMLAYLNSYILKSGAQSLKVEIFPKNGEEFLAPDASVDVKLLNAPDKDSPLADYKTLIDTSFSEVGRDEQLKYYELKLPFNAVVPYDFGKELSNAIDLQKIPDIEKRTYAKYNEIRRLIEEGDVSGYLTEQKKQQIRIASSLYATKEDVLSDQGSDNVDVNMLNTAAPKRRVMPLDSCELVFGYGGKLVLLREKKSKKKAVRVVINQGENNEEVFDTNILLYMPFGSHEIKIW